MPINSQKSNVCSIADCTTPALHVPGLGDIDQYGSYVDSFWSKGVAYFLRDSYIHQIESLMDTPALARPLIDRLNRLNSDILEWEQNGRLHSTAVGGGDGLRDGAPGRVVG